MTKHDVATRVPPLAAKCVGAALSRSQTQAHQLATQCCGAFSVHALVPPGLAV
jgi:hypothetical protein